MSIKANNRFEGKVVVITGAASGIGAACAERIAAEGGKIAILDLNLEKGEEMAEKINSDGGEALFAKCDISNQDDAKNALDAVLGKWGAVDALVNNAGILRFDNFLELNLDDFDTIIRVNLKGNFIMTQTFLPEIIKTKGSVVNVASTAALGHHAYTTAYSASKGGVFAYTKALTNEYAKQGVNFNCVCPASIATPMSNKGAEMLPKGFDPMLLAKAAPFDGPPRTPDYVASTVAFLASEDGKHINGDRIITDGGMMA